MIECAPVIMTPLSSSRRQSSERRRRSVRHEVSSTALDLRTSDFRLQTSNFHASKLPPRMVLALGVSLQLLLVEVDLAQIAGAVAARLIVEVRRRGIAALPACRHGSRAYAIAELDDGDEAVARGAVDLLRSLVRSRAE